MRVWDQRTLYDFIHMTCNTHADTSYARISRDMVMHQFEQVSPDQTEIDTWAIHRGRRNPMPHPGLFTYQDIPTGITRAMTTRNRCGHL
jgi:hypothetical protein